VGTKRHLALLRISRVARRKSLPLNGEKHDFKADNMIPESTAGLTDYGSFIFDSSSSAVQLVVVVSLAGNGTGEAA